MNQSQKDLAKQTIEVNCQYQYEDNDMRGILLILINRCNLLATYTPNYTVGTTAISLKQYLQDEKKQHRGVRTLLIPYNIEGSHWIGIFVAINAVERVTKVISLDPLGRNEDREAVIKRTVLEASNVYPELATKNVIFQNGWLQEDVTSCGPLTIENLLLTARRDELPARVIDFEELQDIRRRHIEIYHEEDPNFYERQKNNINRVASIQEQYEWNTVAGTHFTFSELEKMIKIINLLKKSDNLQNRLLKAFASDNDEHKKHLRKIRKKLSKIRENLEANSNEENIFFELIMILFGLDFEKAKRSDFQSDFKIPYQAFEEIVNNIDKTDEEIKRFHDNVQEQIKDDEKFARKLQKKLWNAQENSSDLRLLPERYKDLKADGLRKTLHGDLYQLAVLILVAHRASNDPNVKDFHLISETPEFEKFDDVVIDTGNKITFIQVKHGSESKDGKVNKYNKSSFKSKEGDASLAKYFDSWMKLKRGKYAKNDDGSEKDSQFVFFTNKAVDNGIGDDDFLMPISDKETESDMLFKDIGNKTYKFKQQNIQEFISAIQLYSKEIKEDERKGVNYEPNSNDLKQAIDRLCKKCKDDKNIKKDEKNQRSIKEGTPEMAAALKDIIRRHREKKLLDLKLGKNYEQKIKRVNEYLDKVNFSVHIKADAKYNGVLTDKIKEFLAVFIIKIKQPDRYELSDILLEEFGLNNSIGVFEFYDAMNKLMLDWFSKRHQCVLTSSDFNREKKLIQSDLQRYYLFGRTQLYEEECKKTEIPHEKLAIEKLLTFFTKKNPECFAMCLTEEIPFCGIKQRVYQTIQTYNAEHHGFKDAEWFYTVPNTPYFNALPVIIQGKSIKLVIIDLRQLTNLSHDVITELKSIFMAVKQNNKLLLLLVSNGTENANSLKTTIDEFKAEPLSIGKLEQKQLEKICDKFTKKAISAGGHDIKIADILTTKEGGIYEQMRKVEMLEIILSSSSNKKQRIETGLPYNVYIPNKLVKGVPIYSFDSLKSFIMVTHVIIENVKKSVYERINNAINEYKKALKMQHTSSQEILEFECNWDEGLKEVTLCKSAKILTIPSSYLKAKLFSDSKDGIELTITANETGRMLPIPLRYDFSDPDAKDFSSSFFSKEARVHFSVLSANAGHGKSAYCLNYRKRWFFNELEYMQDRTDFWVVRVDLPRLSFTQNKWDIKIIFTKTATGVDWKGWEIEALVHDMKISGHVRLFLDGFDEIKDELHIEKINQWLTMAPTECDVLLTTRPYAANKVRLPNQHQLSNYFELKPYNEQQIQDYIKAYLFEIFNEEAKKNRSRKSIPSDSVISELVKQIYSNINASILNQQLANLLGIPLECYLYCESLKPRLIEAWLNSTHDTINIDTLLNEISELTVVKLYKRFIRTKLQLFLVKHMKMSLSDSLKLKHRIYGFTTSYTEIVMIFALRQAFNLPYGFIKNELKTISYTKEMLKELEDIGIGALEDDVDGKVFKFSHETYQVYLSCIYILKKLMLEGDSTEHVTVQIKDIIIEHCYEPRYHTMMAMMAQISLDGDPLLPAWDINKEEHIKFFWRILCEAGDCLGSAESRLFTNCIVGLSEQEWQILKENIAGTEWAASLSDFLETSSRWHFQENSDVKSDEALPVLSTVGSEISTQSYNNKSYLRRLKNELKDKSTVFEKTKNAIGNGINAVELAKIFTDIIKEKTDNFRSTSLNYWDCDGGFDAIKLIGDGFNKELAKVLVKLVENEPRFYGMGVIDIIHNLYKPNLCQSAKDACFIVVEFYLDDYNALDNKELNEIESIIQIEPKHLLISLLLKLDNLCSFSDYSVDLFQEIDTKRKFISLLLTRQVKLLRNILKVMYDLNYAVLIKNTKPLSLSIVGDYVFDFTFNNAHKLFTDVIASILKKISLLNHKEMLNFYECKVIHNKDNPADNNKLRTIYLYRERKPEKTFARVIHTKNEQETLNLTDLEDNERKTNPYSYFKKSDIEILCLKSIEWPETEGHAITLNYEVLKLIRQNCELLRSKFLKIASERLIEHIEIDKDTMINEMLDIINEELIKNKYKDFLEISYRFVIKLLNKNGLLRNDYVQALELEIRKPRATKKYDYWSVNIGIELVSYVGEYFNEKFSNYLILRAGYWPDNKSEAIKALEAIYSTLMEKLAISQSDNLKKAVEAYNKCVPNKVFNDCNLQVIDESVFNQTHSQQSTVFKQLIQASTAYGFFKNGFKAAKMKKSSSMDDNRQKATRFYQELLENQQSLDPYSKAKVQKRLEKLESPEKYFCRKK